jgi:hypothetical protein
MSWSGVQWPERWTFARFCCLEHFPPIDDPFRIVPSSSQVAYSQVA